MQTELQFNRKPYAGKRHMPSSADTRLICAPPWGLGKLWPAVGGLLLRGVLAGESDPEFALDELRQTAGRIVDGRDQLWLAVQDDPPKVLAVFCTSIMREDDGRLHLFVHTAGGDSVLRWGGLVPATLDAFARAEGCASIRYEGRAAWTRALPATAISATEFERILQ
jgi:hypothetical protein